MLCFHPLIPIPEETTQWLLLGKLLDSKSSAVIAAYIGKKFTYLFTFAESQQCHPLSHLSVSSSFIIQNASNNETVQTCLLSLYIVSVFIGLCFYLDLYLSALSAYSASVSHTHRHIYIHMRACTQIYRHI